MAKFLITDQLAYNAIPKNGSTSVLSAIYKKDKQVHYDDIDFPAQGKVHTALPITRVDRSSLDSIQDKFVFTTIRHPYTRFVSAFYDKIFLNNDKLASEFYYKNNKRIDNINLFFSYFIDYMLDTNLQDVDAHFRSQEHFLMLDSVKYDKVMTVETLPQDWEYMKTAFLLPDLPTNSSSTNTTNAAKYVDYNSVLYEKVEMLYKNDFEIYSTYVPS